MATVAAHGTPRGSNGITQIMENSVRQALPSQRGHNANGFVPDLKSEIPLKETTDSESAAFMAADLRKKAETCLSPILPFSPWVGLGNDFRYVSVIPLPRPGLPWGFTLDTRGNLPTRATLGRRQAYAQQALLSASGIGKGYVT